MLKHNFARSLFVFAALLFMTPANAADPVDLKGTEMKLMMDASGKMLAVVSAQLEGDTTKLEKAAAETISIYDQVITVNPTHVKALNARANVKNAVRKGDGDADFMEVIEITTAAISLDAKDASAFHGRAVANRGLRKFDQARADYKKAIELNPAMGHWVTELKAMETEVQ